MSRGAPSLYLVSLESLNFNNYDPQTVHAIPIKQLIRRGVPRLCGVNFCRLPLSTCNGLVLIYSPFIEKIWAIWNPLTRECHELPPPQPHPPNVFWKRGLGYDHATDDYKVVRIPYVFDGAHELQCGGTQVYSMKLGSWRMVKVCPYRLNGNSDGVFLNGALHWLSREFIVGFDIGTEDYRVLPLLQEWSRSEIREVNLDALGGCLILSYHDQGMKCVHGWVLNDYGVEKSWIKLFSVKELGSSESVRPVAYLKDKKEVLLGGCYGRTFLLVGVEGNSVKKITIDDHPGIHFAQVFPGSLVRLGDGKPMLGVKRKRKNARSGTRLKFCVRDVVDDSCCTKSSGVGEN